MDSDDKQFFIGLLYSIFASLFGLLSVGLGMKSFASKTWVVSENFTAGLWLRCEEYCEPIRVDPWILSVRIFMILLALFAVASVVAIAVSQMKRNLTAAKISLILFVFAGIFGLVAVSVYTVTTKQEPFYAETKYSTGYIFAWVVTVLVFLADIISFLAYRKLILLDKSV